MELSRTGRWSGLARDVDPSLPSHLLMLASSVAAGGVGSGYAWIVGGQTVMAGVLFGLATALGATLAWVLGRELDPDNPRSAFLGMVLLVPSALVLGPPDLLLTFWCVYLLRCLNRTTGLPAKPLDDLLLVAVSLWLSLQVHPGLLLLTGTVLLLDALLEPGHSRHLVLGGALAILGTAWLLLRGAGFAAGAELAALWPLAVGSLLYLLTALSLPPVRARADDTDEPLMSTRVRTAQMTGLLLAVLVVLLAGIEGLGRILPLWSALIGTAGFQLAGWGWQGLRRG